MRTLKHFRFLSLCSLMIVFLTTQNVEGQVLKDLKRKVEDKAVDIADEKLNGKKKKQKKTQEEADEGPITDGQGFQINRQFINRGNTIFFDDFNGRKPGSFQENGHRLAEL